MNYLEFHVKYIYLKLIWNARLVLLLNTTNFSFVRLSVLAYFIQ